MKKFYLLKLFPCVNLGGFSCSGNKVINEFNALTKLDAVEAFQYLRPDLKLDNEGYAKHGEISYCVAESSLN
jgi:hypothetical protein